MESIIYNKTIKIKSPSERIVITLTIKQKDRTKETITHETVDNYETISFVGEIYEKKRRKPSCCGQCQDEIRDIAHQYGISDLVDLCDLWDKWHLNDLRAGYGSKWMLEPLPASEKLKIITLVEKL